MISANAKPMRWLVLLPCLLLSGCVGGLTVSVSGTDHPVFTVRRPVLDSFGRACVGEIVVSAAEAGGDPAWYSYTTAKPVCQDRLRLEYGVTPPGYTDRFPAKPLKDHTVYVVTVSGPARVGMIYFEKRSGAYVEVKPPR